MELCVFVCLGSSNGNVYIMEGIGFTQVRGYNWQLCIFRSTMAKQRVTSHGNMFWGVNLMMWS